VRQRLALSRVPLVCAEDLKKGQVDQLLSHALVPLETKGVASRTPNGNFMIESWTDVPSRKAFFAATTLRH
jgi:hypothetical protein